MKTIKQYKKDTVKEVDELLKNGMSDVEKIETMMNELLPFGPSDLCKLSSDFEKEMADTGYGEPNSLIEKAFPKTYELLVEQIDAITLVERYIALHVPSMEDGNNFGVSVQMVISKHLKGIREGCVKRMESMPTYYSSRADAVEKLGLSKVTETSTTTESSSSSSGGKDGDEDKKSSSTTKEVKQTNSPKPDELRVKHVVSIDVKCYYELRSICSALIAGYLSIYDNIEKNKEKLVTPKGVGGRGINMAMY